MSENNGNGEQEHLTINDISVCCHCGCIVADSHIDAHRKFHMALAELAKSMSIYEPAIRALSRIILGEE